MVNSTLLESLVEQLHALPTSASSNMKCPKNIESLSVLVRRVEKTIEQSVHNQGEKIG
jgi:hypothetical protein